MFDSTLFPTDLPIARYRITLKALDPVELAQFSAATLRGAFGWSFKRLVCYQPQVKTCDGCMLRRQCPYPRVFEPPPPSDTIYAGQERSVSPYVLRPPAEEQRRFAAGESLSFEMVLIGQAITLLPYFALSLQQMEQRGLGRGHAQVQVTAIDALPPPGQGDAIRLFDAATPDLIQNHPGWPATDWLSSAPPPAQLTVQFLSPTRLQSNGRVQGQPTFAVLYRALLRRVSALCTCHTDHPWETDFAGLVAAAQTVQTLAASMTLVRRRRYSDRQGEMELWGAQGLMVYQGDLTPFWPLLQLGQVLHVGKNCTFGLGQYRLFSAE